ncbi:MAG: serine hydrolase domain-containing protein [Sandaracinaceae bacterium]
MIEAVTQLIDAACDLGDPPAVACAVIHRGALVHSSAHGGDATGPTTTKSVFDVASVSKVLATTVAVARLVSDGALTFDTDVRGVLPDYPHTSSVRALLGHRSGLAAWRPFFVEVMQDPIAGRAFIERGAPSDAFTRGRALVLEGVFATPLEHPGKRVYSDLGFITLGALVEAVAGASLEVFSRAHFAEDMGFVNLAQSDRWLDDRHVPPTGQTRPREPAPGQEALFTVPEQTPRPDARRVDDDNAFAMGGVAGHAGVFATAEAVARFGSRILDTAEGGDALGVSPAVMEQLMRIDPADGPARALGFDVPTGTTSTAGTLGRGPKGAVGHLGFTGCSLWMDRDRQLSVALLTNRTFPGRRHVKGIRALRPLVHSAVAAATR